MVSGFLILIRGFHPTTVRIEFSIPYLIVTPMKIGATTEVVVVFIDTCSVLKYLLVASSKMN
jgi:hypothetical protein